MMAGQDQHARALVELLAWYEEMGVDIALDDEPADRFAESARPRPAITAAPAVTAENVPADASAARRAEPGPPDPRSGASAAPAETFRPLPTIHDPVIAPTAQPALARSRDDQIEDARRAAATAATLADLETVLASYDGVGLKKTASRLVFAAGNPQARVMMVGEAPGRDEDREGVPFVGRAGQLLDRMLAAIGLDREGVYIANVVPWRPPGNRTPTPQETELCLPFIRRQIELADPDFLIFLGGSAFTSLTDAREGILRARGRWREYDTGRRTIRAMPTLHPAYLLRSPLQKRLAWRDLMALKTALDGEAAG